MTKNRERLIMWIVLELIFIALVFIGSVYDFNITYALSGVTVQGGKLVSNVSCIAKALEVLGEWPALLFTSFALCVIVRNIRKLVKKSNIALLFVVLCDVAVLVLIFRGWHASFKDVFGAVKGWYYAIIIRRGQGMVLCDNHPADARAFIPDPTLRFEDRQADGKTLFHARGRDRHNGGGEVHAPWK